MEDSLTAKISGFADNFARTVKSAVRMMALAGGATVAPSLRNGRPLVILGNGPSLRRNLDEDMDLLGSMDTLAVNFAANAPEFQSLRPTYYLLADPHFFDKAGSDPNVARLVENLNGVDFPMQLFIPAKARGHARLFGNPNLSVGFFNFLAAEGFGAFEDYAFDRRLGMPRPRNVLVPSIMTGIWLGYRKIYLLGADHSWLRTLTVNDRNEVVSVQPHFYKEDDMEQTRVTQEYLRHPLHEVLESMMIAFRSYHRIQRYAAARGVEVINATPGSMIDAFPRGLLPSLSKI